MRSPKPKPVTAPPKKGSGRPKKPITGTALEKINPDPIEVQSAHNLKDQLTVKELKFIEIYLSGDLNVDEAMISAGYIGYHPKSLYRLGRKIVEKFESQGGDYRKIARAIGAGEVTILSGLLELAKGARSEQVRCRAWQALASILGLKGEITESFEGVTLMVYGQEEAKRLGIEDGPALDAKPPIPLGSDAKPRSRPSQFGLPDDPPPPGWHLLCHLPEQLARNPFVAHPHHRHKFSGSSQYPGNRGQRFRAAGTRHYCRGPEHLLKRPGQPPP